MPGQSSSNARPGRYSGIISPARHRAQLDPVKRMISQAIQHHTMAPGPDRPPLAEQPDSVDEVTAEAVNALVTVVRVKLSGDRVRVFQIKLTEVVSESTATA